jgi:AcrR family transcriptional regulator
LRQAVFEVIVTKQNLTMARPRNKTETEALQAALLLFWEKGYDRTSLADLSKALGVGPSSIYSTFGSKADLFRKALQRYMAEYAHFVPDMIGRAPEVGVESTLRQLMRAQQSSIRQRVSPAAAQCLKAVAPTDPTVPKEVTSRRNSPKLWKRP